MPSVLYRLNQLLSVEELRREIARSTGVGVPWKAPTGAHESFERLNFEWDRKKEIEFSSVPDVETDVNAIQNQLESEAKIKNNNEKMMTAAAAATTTAEANTYDSSWNFEISTWDDACLKEISNRNNGPKSVGIGKADKGSGTGGMFFIDKAASNLLASKLDKEIIASGWLDEEENGSGKPKTLFINTNDIEFFADEFLDEMSDTEAAGDQDNNHSELIVKLFVLYFLIMIPKRRIKK